MVGSIVDKIFNMIRGKDTIFCLNYFKVSVWMYSTCLNLLKGLIC